MDRIKLADGYALIDLLQTHPRAHLVCGHIHRTISGSTRGLPWTMLKITCHQGLLDLATDESSLSVEEPPAYGLILLQDDGVIIHSQDVGIGQYIQFDSYSR